MAGAMSPADGLEVNAALCWFGLPFYIVPPSLYINGGCRYVGS